MRRSWAVAAVLCSARAFAHDADVIYVAAEAEGATLRESMTLTAQTLGQLAPMDADGDGLLSQGDLDARGPALALGVWDQAPVTAQGVRCEREGASAVLRQGFVELAARFRCGPGELRQDFKFLSVLPANYRVVLGTQLEGEKNRAFAQGTLSALTIPRAQGASGLDAFGEAVGQGVARAVALLAGAALLALGLLVCGLWWWRTRRRR